MVPLSLRCVGGISVTRCYSKAGTPLLEDIKDEFRNLGDGGVRLTNDDTTGIAHLKFCNEERKNAFSGKMMCEMNDAVNQLHTLRLAGKCKAVILASGDPSIFCAGGDLQTVKQIFSYEGGKKMSTLMHDTMWKLTFSKLISATLIRGRAIGGGAELCTATDFRIFTPDASMTFVQARMGITTGWGGGTRLAAIVGHRQALKLLLSGSKIDFKEASALGLCDHVIMAPNADLVESEAELWLKNLVASNLAVTSAYKVMSSEFEKEAFEKQLSLEQNLFCELWSGDAHSAAIHQNIKH